MTSKGGGGGGTKRVKKRKPPTDGLTEFNADSLELSSKVLGEGMQGTCVVAR